MPEKLNVNKIQIETIYQVGAIKAVKGIIIVVNFCSHKGKQRVLNKARYQKRGDIYVNENLFKRTVAIKKENSEKTKTLRQQGK